ncbi:MAG TPA: flagellar biosynthetic protein FliO [Lautropia sp.]|jgi:flagellar protein FliO/FliZ|nr:flagellar biosynthetic protein FliO [Lautropia sp.]
MSPALGSFAVLLLVIAAIPVVLWMVKRLSQLPVAGGGPLTLVASLALGPRERVALIKVEERWLLVGITAGSINTLAELASAPSLLTQAKPPFADVLARLRRGA